VDITTMFLLLNGQTQSESAIRLRGRVERAPNTLRLGWRTAAARARLRRHALGGSDAAVRDGYSIAM